LQFFVLLFDFTNLAQFNDLPIMCLENAIEFCQRKLEVTSVYVTEGKLQITILIVSDIAKVQEGNLMWQDCTSNWVCRVSAQGPTCM